MKPELVSYDVGKHNAMLDWSVKRMADSAQWKKQRTIVILPASNSISTKVALSHWKLIFPPNNGVHRMIALGQEVGEAYNNAIQAILDHPELSQWEYVLTVEHDNVPPPDGLVKLIMRVQLISSNAFGNDTLNTSVLIGDVPNAVFLSLVANNQVQFTNNTTNANSYVWQFGDGNTSTIQNPTHTYTTGGTYTVKLIATNNCGMDTSINTVLIVLSSTSEALKGLD